MHASAQGFKGLSADAGAGSLEECVVQEELEHNLHASTQGFRGLGADVCAGGLGGRSQANAQGVDEQAAAHAPEVRDVSADDVEERAEMDARQENGSAEGFVEEMEAEAQAFWERAEASAQDLRGTSVGDVEEEPGSEERGFDEHADASTRNSTKLLHWSARDVGPRKEATGRYLGEKREVGASMRDLGERLEVNGTEFGEEPKRGPQADSTAEEKRTGHRKGAQADGSVFRIGERNDGDAKGFEELSSGEWRLGTRAWLMGATTEEQVDAVRVEGLRQRKDAAAAADHSEDHLWAFGSSAGEGSGQIQSIVSATRSVEEEERSLAGAPFSLAWTAADLDDDQVFPVKETSNYIEGDGVSYEGQEGNAGGWERSNMESIEDSRCGDQDEEGAGGLQSLLMSKLRKMSTVKDNDRTGGYESDWSTGASPPQHSVRVL